MQFEYIYGKLNEQIELVKYKGARSNSAQVIVNPNNNEISVEISTEDGPTLHSSNPISSHAVAFLENNLRQQIDANKSKIEKLSDDVNTDIALVETKFYKNLDDLNNSLQTDIDTGLSNLREVIQEDINPKLQTLKSDFEAENAISLKTVGKQSQSISGDLQILGDLRVSGKTINQDVVQETLKVNDNLIIARANAIKSIEEPSGLLINIGNIYQNQVALDNQLAKQQSQQSSNNNLNPRVKLDTSSLNESSENIVQIPTCMGIIYNPDNDSVDLATGNLNYNGQLQTISSNPIVIRDISDKIDDKHLVVWKKEDIMLPNGTTLFTNVTAESSSISIDEVATKDHLKTVENTLTDYVDNQIKQITTMVDPSDNITSIQELENKFNEQIANLKDNPTSDTDSISELLDRIIDLENNYTYTPINLKKFRVNNHTNDFYVENGVVVNIIDISFQTDKQANEKQLYINGINIQNVYWEELLDEQKLYNYSCKLIDLNYSEDLEISLSVGDGKGPIQQKSIQIQFIDPIYYGVSAKIDLSSKDDIIECNFNKIISKFYPQIAVNALQDQYIYYVIPNIKCKFSVNGFIGGFTLINQVESYNIYRSNQSNLGNIVIDILKE